MKSSVTYVNGIEEKQFVKLVMDYAKRADTQNRPFYTHFYNKDWMQSLMEHYVHQEAYLNYEFYGGYEGAERQVLAISPYTLEKEDYGISAIEIQVKVGIGKALSHRDYLGALLGIGIERYTVGDIILQASGAYVLVEKSMVPYIKSELVSIGRYQKINIEEIALEEICLEKTRVKVIDTTVSALRMDAICAVAFGMSRSTSAKLIEADKARCNGLLVGASARIKEGDTITLRGFGKAKIMSVNGVTKKERMHITIEKYI